MILSINFAILTFFKFLSNFLKHFRVGRKELFIRFTASAFRELLSIFVFIFSLLVLRAGCGIRLYQFLIIADFLLRKSFYFFLKGNKHCRVGTKKKKKKWVGRVSRNTGIS